MSNTPESLNDKKFDALADDVNAEVLGGLSASTQGTTHEVSENDEGHYECDDHDEGKDSISVM